jgi:hypothetical protein
MATEQLPPHLARLDPVYRLVRTRTMAAYMQPKVVKTVTVRVAFPAARPKDDMTEPAGSVGSTSKKKIREDGQDIPTLEGAWTASIVVNPGFTLADKKVGSSSTASPTTGGSSNDVNMEDDDDQQNSNNTNNNNIYAATLNLAETLKRHPNALKITRVTIREKRASPPSLHTEGSLIQELKENGVGRPSTYPTIVRTLIDRGYVEYKERNRPATTSLGRLMVKTAQDVFPKLVDIGFTAEFERSLDAITKCMSVTNSKPTDDSSSSSSSSKNPVEDDVKLSDAVLSSFLNSFLGNVTETARLIKAGMAARVKGVEFKHLPEKELEKVIQQAVLQAKSSVPCCSLATRDAKSLSDIKYKLKGYLSSFVPTAVSVKPLSPAGRYKAGEVPAFKSQLHEQPPSSPNTAPKK